MLIDEILQLADPLVAPRAELYATRTELYPYQRRLIEELDRAIAAGHRRIVIQLPTGGGKTLVAAALTVKALADGGVLFNVPAIDLINQTVQKFLSEGITDIGVMQAQHELTDFRQPVQVSTVQTLSHRAMPKVKLVLLDEVHRWHDIFEAWIDEQWQGAIVIGLSATPWRKGLGKFFTKLIIGPSPQQLIDGEYLVPFRVFAPSSPDLTGVHTVGGDFHKGDLSRAMDKTALIADVVATWIERGEDRPTLVFAVDRAHAKHLQEKFIAAGITAGYVDFKTPIEEREQLGRALRAGTIKVVVNVTCLTIGVDWPEVSCISLARPTKSAMLYVQIIGRGLRTAPGKKDLLVLDHSSNTLRLGFVTDVYAEHTALDDGKAPARAPPSTPLPKPCPKCAFLKPPRVVVCPNCGFAPVRQNTVQHQDGELVELTSRTTVKPPSDDERRLFYRELRVIGAERGRKPGWCAHKFRNKFGVGWPPGDWQREPIPTDIAPRFSTRQWVKSQDIAFARAMAQEREREP